MIRENYSDFHVTSAASRLQEESSLNFQPQSPNHSKFQFAIWGTVIAIPLEPSRSKWIASDMQQVST